MPKIYLFSLLFKHADSFYEESDETDEKSSEA